MDDEGLYSQVVDELRRAGPRPGLWAKAFAEARGNDSEAKALYLKYRVIQLREEQRVAQREEANQIPWGQNFSDAQWTAIGVGLAIGVVVLIAIISSLIK
jgi:hypothetical protein